MHLFGANLDTNCYRSQCGPRSGTDVADLRQDQQLPRKRLLSPPPGRVRSASKGILRHCYWVWADGRAVVCLLAYATRLRKCLKEDCGIVWCWEGRGGEGREGRGGSVSETRWGVWLPGRIERHLMRSVTHLCLQSSVWSALSDWIKMRCSLLPGCSLCLWQRDCMDICW